MRIGRKTVGPGAPAFIIAELSANHGQQLDRAVSLVHAAGEAGADAIKLQTYTPETITLDLDTEPFQIRAGTVWDGGTLHSLYSEAYTPWEWHAELQREAVSRGMEFFSSPFDPTAVEFLESLDVPAYKVASPEIVDLGLIEAMARTGKPMIISTGMATLAEIDEAIRAAREAGASEIALLKCTSAYPAPVDEANLRTIPSMAQAFGVPVGLSDHTLGMTTAIAAVALGAALVEKHFTWSRADGGPDSGFSMEPAEFGAMVAAIRDTEQAVGEVSYGPTAKEAGTRALRRSLFVVTDISAGDEFTASNLRSIRPADGLHTRYLPELLGRRARRDIARGTPMSWDLVD